MLPSALLAVALATSATARCSRTFLNDAIDSYLAAQSKGEPTALFTLTDNFNYTEQFKPANISSGILSKALQIDHNLSIKDPVLCTAFTELIVLDPGHPYVIGTRMELDGQRIKKIETLVTDEGDWLFNATGYAYYSSLENWDIIPEDQRDSREVIQAAGDAYFNRFADANITVPFGTPCARLEGGAYTGGRNISANTCNLGLPSTIKVVDRRYVVDEEMGAVNIYVGFPGLDRASKEPGPDSHLFRVEKGKLRYIHTVSTCEGHPGCGLSNTTFVPGRTA
ncbi:hypothetical protein BCR34DRAFT_472358 [Clohesyomyces aquaticus]|uniref:DUF8021 domain-containing protein n=1 Tax=Clohesyomyces aquaticus TaxID=1231657 RepID=A0A1Y2A9V8_9PLEO|nr:hypothetical protein BCR34DRAFT_472358 [Clohesyomyces aquaticus]